MRGRDVVRFIIITSAELYTYQACYVVFKTSTYISASQRSPAVFFLLTSATGRTTLQEVIRLSGWLRDLPPRRFQSAAEGDSKPLKSAAAEEPGMVATRSTPRRLHTLAQPCPTAGSATSHATCVSPGVELSSLRLWTACSSCL